MNILSPLTISLLIAVLIIIIAIVYLIVHIVKTIKASKETLQGVNGTMTKFEKQAEGITSEISSLTDKADNLNGDLNKKSTRLDNFFFGLDDMKDAIRNLSHSIIVLSNNISSFSTAEMLDAKQALEWGKDRKSTRLNSSHVAISYAVY